MFAQIAAVTAMSLRSSGQRLGLSIATVLTIAVVVAVLLFFQAMYQGFQKTVQGTGADDIAIVLRTGSETELNSVLGREVQQLIEAAPGLAQSEDGPLVSAELYVIVDGKKPGSSENYNLPLRGIGPNGQKVRAIDIVEGRMFDPGTTELVVGRSLQSQFVGFTLGNRLRFGQSEWTVVGVFEADGSVFESELWADARTVQTLFNRSSGVQSIRLKLADPAALDEVRAYAEADKRLSVDIESERGYFTEQNSLAGQLIQLVGYPVAFAMALGSLAGALNAMYTAVAGRRREIATLRAIGFNGFSAFVGTLAESLMLALLGGFLGAGAAFLLFDGLTTSTLGSGFTQVVFQFELDPRLFLNGLALALAIGLIGGTLPAFRAARIPLVAAFRDDA